MTRFEHLAITWALLIPAGALFIIATASLLTDFQGDFGVSAVGCLLLLGAKVWESEHYRDCLADQVCREREAL